MCNLYTILRQLLIVHLIFVNIDERPLYTRQFTRGHSPIGESLSGEEWEPQNSTYASNFITIPLCIILRKYRALIFIERIIQKESFLVNIHLFYSQMKFNRKIVKQYF
jgi:hypothetical protein